MRDLLPLPGQQDAQSTAEWLELNLLFGRLIRTSKTAIREFLDDDLALSDSDWDVSDFEADEHSLQYEPLGAADERVDDVERRVDDTLSRLERRALLLGAAYPLTVGHDTLAGPEAWQDHAAYSFLALLGSRHRRWLDLPTAVVRSGAVLFEHLAVEALSAYLDGEGYRFGWPPNEEVAGQSFEERLDELCSRMGERAHRDSTVIGPRQKDLKLDVAAWKRLDSRSSKLIILCQCAIGIDEDLTEHVVPVRLWEKVISFATVPAAAVATSKDLSEVEIHEWETVASVAGVVLDRFRLASLLEADLPEWLNERVVEWVTEAERLLTTT